MTKPQTDAVPGNWNAAERVAAGAAWLDTDVPTWFERVQLTTLNMSYGTDCIIGQVYGDWWDYFDVHTEAEAVDLGFQSKLAAEFTYDRGVPSHEERRQRDEEYKALGDEWERVITARHESKSMNEGTVHNG